ncbi:MAG: FIST N-terminal domain-containing protein [Pseudomonadota bacterium]
MAHVLAPDCVELGPDVIRKMRVEASQGNASREIGLAMGEDLAAVFAFVSPKARFHDFAAALDREIPAPTVACTTAGEIDQGYVDDGIVALGLPRSHFAVATIPVPSLDDVDRPHLINEIARRRQTLEINNPAFEYEFAFLVVDGTSEREDMLIDVISHGIGSMPVFGGSAGDGTRFHCSLVAYKGRTMERAAVLTLVRTSCPVQVFSFDHLEPGEDRMVVTRADPDKRLVMEINASPTASEYARLLGKDRDNLDPFTFAAHPLVVRVAGSYFVRSIQRITPEGHLKFFSAIDEGVVLTVAALKDIAKELEQDFSGIYRGRELDTVLACDCVLRRIAAQQTQASRDVSSVLERHKVVGFSTYGEQVGGMHVNLTMTGVALFRPPETH